jgi:hypothetical protein
MQSTIMAAFSRVCCSSASSSVPITELSQASRAPWIVADSCHPFSVAVMSLLRPSPRVGLGGDQAEQRSRDAIVSAIDRRLTCSAWANADVVVGPSAVMRASVVSCDHVADISVGAVSAAAGGGGFMLLGAVAVLFLTSRSPVVAIIAVTALFGLMLGTHNVTNQAALYQEAPAEKVGIAAGLLRTFGYVSSIASATITGIVFRGGMDDAGLRHVSLIVIGDRRRRFPDDRYSGRTARSS